MTAIDFGILFKHTKTSESGKFNDSVSCCNSLINSSQCNLPRFPGQLAQQTSLLRHEAARWPCFAAYGQIRRPQRSLTKSCDVASTYSTLVFASNLFNFKYRCMLNRIIIICLSFCFWWPSFVRSLGVSSFESGFMHPPKNSTIIPCLTWSLIQAKAFLQIVVLVAFLDIPDINFQDLDFVELFSGKARVSKLASWVGLNVRSFDLNYEPAAGPRGSFKRGSLRRSPMDLNGSAGFAKLGWSNKVCYTFCCMCFWFGSSKPLGIRINIQSTSQAINGAYSHNTRCSKNQRWFNPENVMQLRLAVALCLCGRFAQALYIIAVVCSTWSSVNLGTSQRDILTPYGNCAVPSVNGANIMVARPVMPQPKLLYRIMTK